MEESFEQPMAFKSSFSNFQQPSSSYKTLPFQLDQAAQLLPVGNSGSCMVALSSQFGTLYMSQKWAHYDKMNLTDPWSDYSMIYELDLSNFDSAQRMASLSSDKLAIVTSTSVIVLTMSSDECGKVLDARVVVECDDGEQPWGAQVSAVAGGDQNRMWVASESMLYQVSITYGTVTPVPFADGMASNVERGAVHAVYLVPQWSRLYVSTDTVFYMLSVPKNCSDLPSRVQHEWITGVLDSPVTSMAFDTYRGNALWLAEDGALHRMDVNGRFDRFGYHQGAPFVTNITSVAITPSAVWVGSDMGAASLALPAHGVADDSMRLSTLVDMGGEPTSNLETDPWKWRVFRGNGYIPSDHLVDIVVTTVPGARTDHGVQDHTVFLHTWTGLGEIDMRSWTLQEKADALVKSQYRHEHDGLTASCGLENYGDVSTYQKSVTDNDGLWTSMHLLGEAYCFMSTADVSCRKTAWTAFTGLEGLANVTGAYPNFPARSFCNPTLEPELQGCGTQDGDDHWVASPNPAYPGYVFKRDTSSDEIDGHLAALPMVYDIVADGADQRARAYALIDGITGGIVRNDLYLIDPTTGQPTQWGFWNPEQLNGNPDHYSERGTNSLGILAYLISAYSITGRSSYYDQFYQLVKDDNYLYDVLNVKIDNPDDDNHSDNELIAMTYHIAFWALERFSVPAASSKMSADEKAREPAVREMVKLLVPSAQRCWALTGAEFDPFFTAMYAGLMRIPVTDAYITRAVWMLRKQPLDLITWPTTQSGRADREMTPFHARDHDSASEVRQVVPLNERPARRFNSDPFQMNEGDGMGEMEPAIYRLPYFMMKYYHLV